MNKAIGKFFFYTFYCPLEVTEALPWDNRHPNGFIFPPLNILILTCSKTYQILDQSWLLAKYMLSVQTSASLSRWGLVSKRSVSVDWRDGLRGGVQPLRIPPTSKTSASISRATVYFCLCSGLAHPRDSFSAWVDSSAHRGSGSLSSTMQALSEGQEMLLALPHHDPLRSLEDLQPSGPSEFVCPKPS